MRNKSGGNKSSDGDGVAAAAAVTAARTTTNMPPLTSSSTTTMGHHCYRRRRSIECNNIGADLNEKNEPKSDFAQQLSSSLLAAATATTDRARTLVNNTNIIFFSHKPISSSTSSLQNRSYARKMSSLSSCAVSTENIEEAEQRIPSLDDADCKEDDKTKQEDDNAVCCTRCSSFPLVTSSSNLPFQRRQSCALLRIFHRSRRRRRRSPVLLQTFSSSGSWTLPALLYSIVVVFLLSFLLPSFSSSSSSAPFIASTMAFPISRSPIVAMMSERQRHNFQLENHLRKLQGMPERKFLPPPPSTEINDDENIISEDDSSVNGYQHIDEELHELAKQLNKLAASTTTTTTTTTPAQQRQRRPQVRLFNRCANRYVQIVTSRSGSRHVRATASTTATATSTRDSTRFVLLPVIKQIKPNRNHNEDDEDEYLPELPTTTTNAPQLLSARLAELDTETETDEEEMAALTHRVKQKLLQIYRIKQERQRLLLEQHNNNSVVELRHDEPLPYFSWTQQQNSSSSSRRRRSLMYAEVYPSAHAQQQQSLPIMTRTTLAPSSPPSNVPYLRRHYVYKNNRRYRTASKTAPTISSTTSRPALVFPTYNNRTTAQDLLFSTRRLEHNNYENQNRVQQVEPTTTTTAKPTAATRSRRKAAFAIYNEATKSYVCLNRQNKPIARRKFKSMQCLFERIDSFPSKTYTRFRLLGDNTDGDDSNVGGVGSSDINDHALFLGFDAHGRGELASTLKRQYRRWRLAQQLDEDGTESTVEETFLPSLHGKALERCFEFRVEEQTLLQ